MTTTEGAVYRFRRTGLDLQMPMKRTPHTGDRVRVVASPGPITPASEAWVVPADQDGDRYPVLVHRTSLSPEA